MTDGDCQGLLTICVPAGKTGFESNQLCSCVRDAVLSSLQPETQTFVSSVTSSTRTAVLVSEYTPFFRIYSACERAALKPMENFFF